jgi:GAF domain-containing protein
MANYALITASDSEVADLYSEIVQAEGLDAVIACDPYDAKRIILERGKPKLVIADLGVAREGSLAMLREVQSSFPPNGRPAVLASVSRELWTTAGDLTDELGIAELLSKGADSQTVGLAVRRALAKEAHELRNNTIPSPPPIAGEVDELDLARIAAMGLINDGPLDPMLEELVAQTAESFGVPVATISLSLDDKQWFKVHVRSGAGLVGIRGFAQDAAFSAYIIESGHPLLVADAAAHPVFASNPLVRSGGVASYAGAPLTTPDGDVIGALCIVDTKPASIQPDRVDVLARLAKRLAAELELRSKARSSALEVIRLTERLAREREEHQISQAELLNRLATTTELDASLDRSATGRHEIVPPPSSAPAPQITKKKGRG